MMIMTGHSDDDDDDEWTFCPQWTSLPIPSMLAPRIEPTAVHMPGLFRKLCERFFGTMEEEDEDEVGKVGSYWTAEDRLAREGTKKPSGCGCVTFIISEGV